MALKKKYAKKNDIPAWAVKAELFEEKDGEWVAKDDVAGDLDDEEESSGGPSDSEVKRQNRELQNQIKQRDTELGRIRKDTEKFKDFDEETYKHYQETVQKARDEEEKALLRAGRVDEVVQKRIARVMEEKDRELTNRTKAFTELEAKYNQLSGFVATDRARKKIANAISKKGLRIKPGAEEDLDMRISQDWTSDENGNLVLRNQNLINDKGAPMTDEDYVSSELLKRRAYFFEAAKGGGAGGNSDDMDNSDARSTIAADDAVAFGLNAEAIDKGTKRVRSR